MLNLVPGVSFQTKTLKKYMNTHINNISTATAVTQPQPQPDSFVHFVLDSFEGEPLCLVTYALLRLGTGVSSWRGSGLTGVLDGETRTGVDPSIAPLQFRAALALSALVNSTNAIRVGWW